MKTNYTILYIMFLLSTLVGCTADTAMGSAEPPTASQEAQVLFSLAVPAQGTPSVTRSMDNDSEIKTFTVWAFSGKGSGATFLKQIDTENAVIRTVNGQLQMFVLLPESKNPVTVVMIANPPPTVATPASNTTKDNAVKTLVYSIETQQLKTMPMYGEVELDFIKYGMPQSPISLKRAMAKIEIDVRDSFDQLVLEEAQLQNVNSKGCIWPGGGGVPSIIATIAQAKTIKRKEDNFITFYIPEVMNINGSSKVSVLLKGTYKGDDTRTVYYRLDFISGESKIEHVFRNYHYKFTINNVKSPGYTTPEDALNAERASNATGISGDWMVIKDEAIMDITTDGINYLGVTSANLATSSNSAYYYVNFGVVTNNIINGWNILANELPDGVTLNKTTHKPASAEEGSIAQSIWVYVDRSKINVVGQVIDLYIYSGDIRKKIAIEIKE